MIKKGLSFVMLICALFSGQLMAGHKGHEYLWVKNVDHQLRHEADSDELRSAAEESAEVCANTTCGRNRANRTRTFGN
jgi:hypothetical protein